MSNDLISRSALLKEINSYTFDTVSPDVRRWEHYARAHICELIDKQPTAYDVDKVVVELQNYPYSDQMGWIALSEVKTIVKAGGVNE